MIEKLEEKLKRLDELSAQMMDPEVIADTKKYARIGKEYKDLEKVNNICKDYRDIIDNINSANEMLRSEKEEEFRQLAKDELEEYRRKKEDMEEEIKLLLIPKDPDDSKNVIMEIRAGTGGDEASIFAGDLFRLYSRLAESRGWKVELVDSTEGTAGGFKEVIYNVIGDYVYGDLKFESGVHRVQRVPKTETQGRIHTSAATVVVLPEADEFDVELKTADIRRDTFCSSGPGGQSVNTTYSAVRLTHIPTGIVATCQDQKSQIKNYDKALAVLRSRIYEDQMRKKQAEEDAKRKSMVSTGDRSAKIRTYNFPQGRVTDHRITLSLYNLEEVMGGKVDEFTEALKIAENSERMKLATL